MDLLCGITTRTSSFRETRADSDHSPKPKILRGKYLRSRAKSHSDISQPPSDESLPPSPQPFTEPSSPYKRILGFKSGKRIHNVINTLKRLAPQKLRHHRTKEYREPPKNNLQNRLSSSHPNVSTTNLAAVAKGSCDDSAVGMSSGSMAITDAASYSDPTIHRNSAESQELLACANDFRHVSNNRLKDTDETRDSGITMDSLDVGIIRQRHSALRQHAFYQLEVHLRFGKDLQARDACGTSDPYVKFKIGGKQLYKSRTVSRTLEPYWDEFFSIPIEDVFEPLHLRVYDYDFALQDDFMGCAQVDLTVLELNR